MSEIRLADLGKPFAADEVEWRVGQCGKTRDGNIWCKVVPYITNRAIQERLDAVCGPENWQNSFIAGPGGGILCGISIRINGEWITKYDGAENTDIESVKGGLSDAMKRCGVQWSIGRYLYRMEEGFAQVVERGTKGAYYGKTKEGDTFYWLPPELPKWALPSKSTPDNLPSSGAELKRRLTAYETTLVGKGLCVAGQLMAYMAALDGYPKDLADWTGEKQMREAAKAVEAFVGVREKCLRTHEVDAVRAALLKVGGDEAKVVGYYQARTLELIPREHYAAILQQIEAGQYRLANPKKKAHRDQITQVQLLQSELSLSKEDMLRELSHFQDAKGAKVQAISDLNEVQAETLIGAFREAMKRGKAS